MISIKSLSYTATGFLLFSALALGVLLQARNADAQLLGTSTVTSTSSDISTPATTTATQGTSTTGASGTTGTGNTGTTVTTPGVPNTGDGGNMIYDLALMAGSGLIALASIRYLSKAVVKIK